MSKPFQIRPLQPKKSLIAQYCAECEEKATSEALFQVQGLFIVVHRYCDKCLSTAEYEIPRG
jgi:hypothetical protein